MSVGVRRVLNGFGAHVSSLKASKANIRPYIGYTLHKHWQLQVNDLTLSPKSIIKKCLQRITTHILCP